MMIIRQGLQKKEKNHANKALKEILQGLQNLAVYIEENKGDCSLVSIAKGNVEKLSKRKAENKIHGDGDNR